MAEIECAGKKIRIAIKHDICQQCNKKCKQPYNVKILPCDKKADKILQKDYLRRLNSF